MSLANVPGIAAVVQYTVPYKGTWNSIAAHEVPADALYKSMNVFIREGKLRNRAGLTLFDDYVFDDTVIGGGLAVTPSDRRLIAITPTHLYEYGEYDSTWDVTAGYDFASTVNDRVDIAFLETSATYVALIAQQQRPLCQWTASGGPTAITPSTGVIPYAKSVCIAGTRVIALIAPHTVVWSSVYDPTSWPADAVARKAQTGDNGICVRTLSALSFVLYKERSIYVVRAQAGSDASAFSFAEPIRAEGPAGIHAVVEVNGTHVYMTRNGRIAMFDGSRYPQWIADGLWLYLQSDIDPLHADTIFGVYDYRLHTITFYYPRTTQGAKLRGMVVINLPLEGMDLPEQQQTPHSFLGVSGVPCTFGYEMRFERRISRSIVFSNNAGDCQSFLADEESSYDDEEVYSCSIQTGLTAMPNALHTQVTFETFLERGVGYGDVLVEPVTSNGLEAKEGTIPDMKGKVISLEYDPVRSYNAFDISPVRFFGLRYSWDSTAKVRYAGAVLYGKSVG